MIKFVDIPYIEPRSFMIREEPKLAIYTPQISPSEPIIVEKPTPESSSFYQKQEVAPAQVYPSYYSRPVEEVKPKIETQKFNILPWLIIGGILLFLFIVGRKGSYQDVYEE